VLGPDVYGPRREREKDCGSYCKWSSVVVGVIERILIFGALIVFLAKGGKSDHVN